MNARIYGMPGKKPNSRKEHCRQQPTEQNAKRGSDAERGLQLLQRRRQQKGGAK